MSDNQFSIVVVGHGAAGLAAALAAAEEARRLKRPAAITLVEKTAAAEAGGNTRWTPAYMRMAAPDHVEPDFVDAMLAATRGQGDRTYFTVLAREAPATAAWIARHGVIFNQPTYYLAKDSARIQPAGGGEALHRELTRAVRAAGVTLRYSCAAKNLLCEGDVVRGVWLDTGDIVAADAVILACGGFQANATMMREHFGADGGRLPLLAQRARFNTGDGIRMALAVGADWSGQSDGMHAEPIDPRSANQAPVVLLYPYGIVVDKFGRRFFDEGAGLAHETWEWLARHLHFNLEGRQAYAILDRRLHRIGDWRRAMRSEVPAIQAGTLDRLAMALGINAHTLAATVESYNAACTGDPAAFDATRRDGLATSPALDPPKSNWARAIVEPPFLAWPLIGAVAYTFGGLATDERARVLKAGTPIPGLYAAGEITGHYYGAAPNAVSVLRALVFGRIAGREAVSSLMPRAAP